MTSSLFLKDWVEGFAREDARSGFPVGSTLRPQTSPDVGDLPEVNLICLALEPSGPELPVFSFPDPQPPRFGVRLTPISFRSESDNAD